MFSVDLNNIEYKYVDERELKRILDKIEFLDEINPFYDRKMIEVHIGEKGVEYCIQSYKGIPLSIGINKFNSFSDNDSTCIELESVIKGYATYFTTNLISNPYIMRNTDRWFKVDGTNILYDRLIKFYIPFQKRFGFKRIDFYNNGRVSTFFYSYPCKNEETAIEYFKSIS